MKVWEILKTLLLIILQELRELILWPFTSVHRTKLKEIK